MNYLIKIKELALDILFPPICLNCLRHLNAEEKTSGLCADCFAKITVHTSLFCSACRARLPKNIKICHKDSAYLLGAATNFDEAARNLIHQLKYHSWSRLQKPIKNLLEIYFKNLNLKLAGNWLVIPIPLHKKRERERGFNQASLIGKIIADYYRLPIRTDILIRQKETKSQTDLKDWEQRKNNLSGAFQVTQPETIKNKNIILVDDVYTSGATIKEAVKNLKLAGAKKIMALVLAKTK